jgi:outer membrane protein assembly factor BamB
MKRLLGAALCVLPTLLPVSGQLERIWSDPAPPPEDLLRRLNLQRSWARFIPMEGRRDRILAVDFNGDDLLIHTSSGLVMRMDAETGLVHWKQRVGRPYMATQPLAANRRLVFVINALYLYALDRRTGIEQWKHTLGAGASTRPLADDRQIYVPVGTGRLDVLNVSAVAGMEERIATSAYDEAPVARGPGPTPAWSVQTNLRLDLEPVLTRDYVFVLGAGGEGQAYFKSHTPDRAERGDIDPAARFNLDVQIEVPPGQHGDTVYIGSVAGNVYAYNIGAGRLEWRTTLGSRVKRQPVALDDDVFVVTTRGLSRLNRVLRFDPATKREVDGGQELWRNRNGDQFLAANAKFVYALDASGRLLVIDRRRGLTLSTADLRAFRVPVPNTVTDRLYLVANNGLIVCLHDRDLPRPFSHRALDEQVDPLRKKLSMPFTSKGEKPAPLADVLTRLAAKAGVKTRLVEGAFRAQGIENIGAKMVAIPASNRKPFGEVLREVLEQANAFFEPEDDTLLILPRAGRR